MFGVSRVETRGSDVYMYIALQIRVPCIKYNALCITINVWHYALYVMHIMKNALDLMHIMLCDVEYSVVKCCTLIYIYESSFRILNSGEQI